jgi:serine protease Do
MPPDRIFEQVAPSVWSVKAYGANEKLLASASGLVIAPGKLITSCQVLARARQVKLRRGNAIYNAKLEFPDVERDLCQFDVPGLLAPVLAQESARTLRPGQRVYVIGFGIGDDASIAEGLVSAMRDSGTQKERIQTTVPAMRGLLGAGVFDQEGRLVGVVTSSPTEAAATAFAVPADWLVELAARGQAALAARSKLAAAAAAAAAPQGLPAAGTSWTYGYIDRQYSRRKIDFTVRALRVDGLAVEESVASAAATDERRVVNAGESRFFEQSIGGGTSLLEFSPYLLAAAGGKAPVIMTSIAGYPPGAGMPEWIEKARVLEWESVTVPAGTFRALRVQVDGRRARSPNAPRVPMIYRVSAWYAPEMGRYVKLEHQQWLNPNYIYAHEVVELHAYRRAP